METFEAGRLISQRKLFKTLPKLKKTHHNGGSATIINIFILKNIVLLYIHKKSLIPHLNLF